MSSLIWANNAHLVAGGEEAEDAQSVLHHDHDEAFPHLRSLHFHIIIFPIYQPVAAGRTCKRVELRRKKEEKTKHESITDAPVAVRLRAATRESAAVNEHQHRALLRC